MKSYKKSSFHKLYLIDVEKKEIIDLNEEHMDGVVEKFNSKPFLWSNAHDCIPCGGFRCGSFPCSGCKKVFTTKFSLKRHFKTFHTVPKCCKYCNARKLHTTPENTKTPQTSAKKYSRQACDKSYTRSHTLKTHMQKCGHTHIQKVHEELKLPQSSAGIKNEFTPDEVDRMTPNVENETLKKPKWTRGQKRKKSMPQGKIFKQIHLEALLDALNSEFGL